MGIGHCRTAHFLNILVVAMTTPLGRHFAHYCHHQSLPISLFIVLIIYYQDQRGAIPGSLQQQRTPASMPRLSTTTPPPCCYMQHKNKKEIKVQCITKTKRKSKYMQHKNKKGIKVQCCKNLEITSPTIPSPPSPPEGSIISTI